MDRPAETKRQGVPVTELLAAKGAMRSEKVGDQPEKDGAYAGNVCSKPDVGVHVDTMPRRAMANSDAA